MNMVRLIKVEMDHSRTPIAIHPNSCKEVTPEDLGEGTYREMFPEGVCSLLIRHGNELESIRVTGTVAQVTDSIDSAMRGFR